MCDSCRSRSSQWSLGEFDQVFAISKLFGTTCFFSSVTCATSMRYRGPVLKYPVRIKSSTSPRQEFVLVHGPARPHEAVSLSRNRPWQHGRKGGRRSNKGSLLRYVGMCEQTKFERIRLQQEHSTLFFYVLLATGPQGICTTPHA